MHIEICKDFRLIVYGLAGIATGNRYADTAFSLSGKMWEIVKSNSLKNKGKNIWIYEDQHSVFAGVELENDAQPVNDLERKEVNIPSYAYFKHIGPYRLISQTGEAMREQLSKEGYQIILPYIEIYGHWTNDESKLETELLISLK